MIYQGVLVKLNGIDSQNIADSLKPISDQLRAMALAGGAFVRVPGTQDIDWAATAIAARPAVDTPYAGGDTFRFDDALQADAPIYFRIRYGHGATNTPALFFQVGSAVDPVTGALAGNVSVMRVMGSGVAVTAAFPLWISGGPNFISLMILGVGANQGQFQFFLERTRDHNGLETPDGAIALMGGHGVSQATYKQRIQAFPRVGGVSADVLAGNHLTPLGEMAGLPSSGTDLAMAPVAAPFNGLWRYITPLTYKITDIAHGSIFDLNHLGEERQYIAIGGINSGAFWGPTSSLTGLAVRWE